MLVTDSEIIMSFQLSGAAWFVQPAKEFCKQEQNKQQQVSVWNICPKQKTRPEAVDSDSDSEV